MKGLSGAPSVEGLSDAVVGSAGVTDSRSCECPASSFGISGNSAFGAEIVHDSEEFAAQAEAEHEEPSEDELGPDSDHDELEERISERCRLTLAGGALDAGLAAATGASVARRRRRGRQPGLAAASR